jgi:3-oxoisoapionate decarboxylase
LQSACEHWGQSPVRTRIGFDHYTIAHRGFTARQTLEFAQAHHFDGVQFLDPTSIDLELDHERLSSFRRQADAMGLYLEIGLPSPNPIHRSDERKREVTPAELARELLPHIEAVAALSCRHARVFVGDRHSRFRTDKPWTCQIEATVEVIGRLTATLKSQGIRLALETHADLTGDEMIALLDRIDPEVAGVTLDTGNIVMRLDDPVELTGRLAPFIVATHVKDAVLAFTPRGLCWQARPVGSGVLPLPDILAVILHQNPAVTLSIELHPRTYDLPIHDEKWISFFPDLRATGLAAVVRLATLAEARYLDDALERPETVEAIPWPSRDLDWLASSLGYLRSVVPTLAAI